MQNAVVNWKGWPAKLLNVLFDLAHSSFEPLVIWLVRGFGFVALLALLAAVVTPLQLAAPGLVFWPSVWFVFLTAHGVVQIVTGVLSVALAAGTFLQTGVLYSRSKQHDLAGDIIGILAVFYAVFSGAAIYWSLRSPELAVFWIVVFQAVLLFIGTMVVVADEP